MFSNLRHNRRQTILLKFHHRFRFDRRKNFFFSRHSFASHTFRMRQLITRQFSQNSQSFFIVKKKIEHILSLTFNVFRFFSSSSEFAFRFFFLRSKTVSRVFSRSSKNAFRHSSLSSKNKSFFYSLSSKNAFRFFSSSSSDAFRFFFTIIIQFHSIFVIARIKFASFVFFVIIIVVSIFVFFQSKSFRSFLLSNEKFIFSFFSFYSNSFYFVSSIEQFFDYDFSPQFERRSSHIEKEEKNDLIIIFSNFIAIETSHVLFERILNQCFQHKCDCDEDFFFHVRVSKTDKIQCRSTFQFDQWWKFLLIVKNDSFLKSMHFNVWSSRKISIIFSRIKNSATNSKSQRFSERAVIQTIKKKQRIVFFVCSISTTFLKQFSKSQRHYSASMKRE